jgi:hypothetical protein
MNKMPLLGLTLGLLLGCQAPAQSQQQKPATVERAKEITATVAALDVAERQVTHKLSDGEVLTLHAGDNVRNLAQVEVGDRVMIRYREAIAAQLAKPGEPGNTGGVSSQATRAPAGAKPSAEVARQIKATVRIEDLDLATHTVSFSERGRAPQTLAVQDPEMQAFLETLKVGDEVEITYNEALAVSVEPAAK